MSDPGPLLGTLAQSSAAVVAIVGGFLVSRLVALSSEREGLRRQLGHAADRLDHVSAAYDVAHSYRFRNSEADFTRWILSDLVQKDIGEVDRSEILAHHVPRGSSQDEMGPILDRLIQRVAEAKEKVLSFILPEDDRTLELNDLQERGLQVPSTELPIYQTVVDEIVSRLPARTYSPFAIPQIQIPRVDNPVTRAAELRRLDESIAEEQTLHGQRTVLEAEVSRVRRELTALGRPGGVVGAIWILAAYSVIGVLVPVVVMAFNPPALSEWATWILVSLFAIGLGAVLAYILWYAKTLNDPLDNMIDSGDGIEE